MTDLALLAILLTGAVLSLLICTALVIYLHHLQKSLEQLADRLSKWRQK